MAYRKLQPECRPPNRSMQDTATTSRLIIHNGATASFAVPVWYAEMRWPMRTKHHSRPLHDHWGWPDPKRPDQSCQHWDFAHNVCGRGHKCDTPHRNTGRRVPQTPFGHASEVGSEFCGPCGRMGHCDDFLDLREFFPARFIEEGYTHATVSFDRRPEGLAWKAWIDPDDDWIVRSIFESQVDPAIRRIQVCSFSLKVHREQDAVPASAVTTGGGNSNISTLNDIVARGRIILLPNPWREGDSGLEDAIRRAELEADGGLEDE